MTDARPDRDGDSASMSQESELVIRPAHDLGGLPPGGPLVRVERDLTPFEKFCHALLNVLDEHKLVNTEEKRRGVEDLGGQIIGALTYYERWTVSAAKVLNEKGVITSGELAARMTDIERRFGGERRHRGAARTRCAR
jgi:Nitrile hydratase beta subunit